MKKLLTILSSISLLGTPMTVIACSGKDDDKKQDILDIINLSTVDISELKFEKFLNDKNTYQEMDEYIKKELIPQVAKMTNETYKLEDYVKNTDLIYVIRDQFGRVVDLSQKSDNLKNGKWYLDFYGNKSYIGNRATSTLTIKGSNLEHVSLNALNLPLVDFMTTAEDYTKDLRDNKANLIIEEIESQLDDNLKGTFKISDLDIAIKYQRNYESLNPSYVEVKGKDIIGGRYDQLAPWDDDRMTFRYEWYTFIKLKEGKNTSIKGELKYMHRIRESAVWVMDIDSFKIPQFVVGTATTEVVVNSIMNEEMRKIFIEDLSLFISSKWAGENFPKLSEWVHLDDKLDGNLRPKPGETFLTTRGSFTLKLAFNKDWKTKEVIKDDNHLRGYIELWINIV